jgi:hypothetical protein
MRRRLIIAALVTALLVLAPVGFILRLPRAAANSGAGRTTTGEVPA